MNDIKEIIINKKVSILLPVYNMADTIEEHLKFLISSIEGFIENYEIILSNDGSKDDSIKAINAIASKYKNIVVVNTEINQGKGHALKRAFEYSSGEYIVFCDADMELPPSQLSTFFEIMQKENVDIVIGSKRHPLSKLKYSWIRRTISFIYFMFVKIVFGLPIRDTQTGLKLFKREALDGVFPRILVKAFAYDLEVLVAAYKNGYSIKEAPITLNANRHNGFIHINILYRTFIDTLAIFYRLRFLKFYENLLGKRNSSPLVSIIIPLKKINDYILECCTWVLKQTYSNFELIILPDKYEESFEHNAIFNDKRIIIKTTGNKSPAIKRHIGTSFAKGEIFAFIDDDTYAEVNWLENAIKVFDNNKDISAIGGVAVTAQNDSYTQDISGMVYANFMTSAKHTLRYTPKKVQYVDDYPSCNFIIKRELYFKSDGFDTPYKYGEDTILCNNITKLGQKILYTPDVLVYHHRRKLFFGHFKQLSSWARHRSHFIKSIGGNSLELSYFVPSLFLIYIIFLATLPFYFNNIVDLLYNTNLSNAAINIIKAIPFIPMMLYFIMLLFSYISTLAPIKGILMCVGIFLTHIVYGFSFIRGFFTSS